MTFGLSDGGDNVEHNSFGLQWISKILVMDENCFYEPRTDPWQWRMGFLSSICYTPLVKWVIVLCVVSALLTQFCASLMYYSLTEVRKMLD